MQLCWDVRRALWVYTLHKYTKLQYLTLECREYGEPYWSLRHCVDLHSHRHDRFSNKGIT